MAIEIPELLSTAEIREVRDQLDAAAWQDGRQTAGHRARSVKTNLQLGLDDPLAQRLGDFLLGKLSQCPLFIASALPMRIVPPRFNRYEGDGAYGSHVDNAIFPGPQGHVRSDLSATIFLNDPDEYDGGELLIDDLFGEHRVKLAAGHMILYPGSSLHRVTPVTRGARFAAFFWVQSLVAQDQQRRMLFELDSAIQALTADHPDHASLDPLTGVYHNLLRQWSIT
ncbi:Fe2+-dependent dioxygenase [Sphingomonas abietis]|uniref:Fe2+-dependent dioxygenase n=1 Tax=Sphingomonas abietis TaxID=3012344 RepID=A0ABY7NI16_9SPHN|nr:Fe2+-dependent dioxygenase [Sphingomonas abietis]WBO20973.1 Fe2+-dependent dioxygenase [Sphingomonas abietis]